MEASKLLRLLQLTDSGFPTGAFAFSHGLEGLVSAEIERGEAEIQRFIALQLREGFGGVECPAMAHAWRAAQEGDLTAILEIDALIDAMKPIPVFRAGSAKTGRRLLESASKLLSSPMLCEFRQAVRDAQTP